jgi:hypothetical protein
MQLAAVVYEKMSSLSHAPWLTPCTMERSGADNGSDAGTSGVSMLGNIPCQVSPFPQEIISRQHNSSHLQQLMKSSPST